MKNIQIDSGFCKKKLLCRPLFEIHTHIDGILWFNTLNIRNFHTRTANH